ncbi:hypothetical protein H6G89_05850 [Oscillatoria sp. FACHB-1407]|uniref:hypothetical protein n=1 Tax=Oscillatoria sp. FACHB-1407 TaxID=2692847 RepID=UPI00168378D2|nr:hypothetical protein [Oscillatoria sp. FACHB-1407]MBD2460563.1 hypothetical protein [Oscillatoria sp. FACHB-1407]
MVTTPAKLKSHAISCDIAGQSGNSVTTSTPQIASPPVVNTTSVRVFTSPKRSNRLAQTSQVPPSSRAGGWGCSLKQHHTIAIAGVAIAASSVGLADVLMQPTPEYEGRFQITTSDPVSATDAEAATQSQSYSAIAPPTTSLEQHLQVLTSAAMLEPAIAQLQAEGIDVDYPALLNNLKVTPTSDPDVIEISYRARDTRQLQAVLETVAAIYTSQPESCLTQTCHSLEFIKTQLSSTQARIATLQDNLAHFQQQHQISHLQVRQQQTLALKTRLGRQMEQNQAKLDATRKQVERLETQLGQDAHPFSATDLLAQSTQYQHWMEQLRTVEQSMTEELQQPQIRQDYLRSLYAQYQALLSQLKAETNRVSTQFILTYVLGQPTPLARQISDVQQWVEVTHEVEILQLYHHRMAQLDQTLDQRLAEISPALEQYAHLQQQLQDANRLLEQYSAQRQQLETLVAAENSWDLVSPPEVLQAQLQ